VGFSVGHPPNTGLRYRAVLPVAELSSFPSPVRTAIYYRQMDFVRRDRGHVQGRNDKNFESRAAHFGGWLERHDISPRVLQASSSDDLIALLGLYLEDILEGCNLPGRSNLADDTVTNYLRSATAWLKTECNVVAPLYAAGDGTRKADKLNPYLAELLAQRRVWRKPKTKKEPITGAIIDAMAQMAEEGRHKYGDFCEEAVLYDICRLGIFTGSRLAEYGQSTVPPGAPSDYWNPIPSSRDVPPDERGKPCAFVISDFEFYTVDHIQLSHSEALADLSRAEYVHIVFRYDKSNNNFIRRKFRRYRGHHLCPVKTVLSMVRRYYQRMPGVSPQAPLGMFIGRNHRVYSIRGRHVQGFMQRACLRAYPDANHYMQIHINRLMSHSLRVMAAVALQNAGVKVDDIAWRLRWNSDAVNEYLRECHKFIGVLTEQAITGAYIDET